MDNRDVHAPTVPSGPTTARSGFPDLSKLSLFELMNEKDRIEAELRAYSSVLTSVATFADRNTFHSILTKFFDSMESPWRRP